MASFAKNSILMQATCSPVSLCISVVYKCWLLQVFSLPWLSLVMAGEDQPEQVSKTTLTRADIPELVKAMAATLQTLMTKSLVAAGGPSSNSSPPGESNSYVYTWHTIMVCILHARHSSLITTEAKSTGTQSVNWAVQPYFVAMGHAFRHLTASG